MLINPKITAAEIADYLGLTVQAIHKRVKQHNITEKKSNSRIYFQHPSTRKLINHNYKQLRISTAVVKGGVGKTTIAESIAVRASLYGLKVLCVDLDQQSNLTKGLNAAKEATTKPVMIDLIENKATAEESIINITEGLDLVPSRLDNVTLDGNLMLKRINLETIFSNVFADILPSYDIVIFDCPPTLGATVCASVLHSDIVISPMNPDVYSYEGIEIMRKEFENINIQFKRDIDWRILLNKFDSKTVLSSDYITKIITDPILSKKLLKSVVRLSQEFPNLKNKSLSLFDNLKKSTAKEDIDALTREIIQIMKNKSCGYIEDKTQELVTG